MRDINRNLDARCENGVITIKHKENEFSMEITADKQLSIKNLGFYEYFNLTKEDIDSLYSPTRKPDDFLDDIKNLLDVQLLNKKIFKIMEKTNSLSSGDVYLKGIPLSARDLTNAESVKFKKLIQKVKESSDYNFEESKDFPFNFTLMFDIESEITRYKISIRFSLFESIFEDLKYYKVGLPIPLSKKRLKQHLSSIKSPYYSETDQDKTSEAEEKNLICILEKGEATVEKMKTKLEKINIGSLLSSTKLIVKLVKDVFKDYLNVFCSITEKFTSLKEGAHRKGSMFTIEPRREVSISSSVENYSFTLKAIFETENILINWESRNSKMGLLLLPEFCIEIYPGSIQDFSQKERVDNCWKDILLAVKNNNSIQTMFNILNEFFIKIEEMKQGSGGCTEIKIGQVDCGICYAEFDRNYDDLVFCKKKECGQVFCKDCLKRWVYNEGGNQGSSFGVSLVACPYCSAEVIF